MNILLYTEFLFKTLICVNSVVSRLINVIVQKIHDFSQAHLYCIGVMILLMPGVVLQDT